MGGSVNLRCGSARRRRGRLLPASWAAPPTSRGRRRGGSGGSGRQAPKSDELRPAAVPSRGQIWANVGARHCISRQSRCSELSNSGAGRCLAVFYGAGEIRPTRAGPPEWAPSQWHHCATESEVCWAECAGNPPWVGGAAQGSRRRPPMGLGQPPEGSAETFKGSNSAIGRCGPKFGQGWQSWTQTGPTLTKVWQTSAKCRRDLAKFDKKWPPTGHQ